MVLPVPDNVSPTDGGEPTDENSGDHDGRGHSQ